ncbi:MAG: sigma 54-interacting transcriptional regulator, partial [Candidatus Acidiferrales bacterium]
CLMVIEADGNMLSVDTAGPGAGLNQYYVSGVSPAMRALERTIADIAPTEIPVLLLGESGTGKEVVALEIHRLSRRWNEAFVKCGCAGLTPDSLAARLESGEKGTETGASSCGSLFLDEISHLEPVTQARLMNLLPDGNGNPSAGCQNVRVISSTTRNLEEEMRGGRFREELYYRISGVHLRLPPLRRRVEDIPALLDFFLKKYASLFARPEPQPSAEVVDLLLRHSWPGNIRELENVARTMVALGDEQLAIHDLANGSAPKVQETATVVTRDLRPEPLPVRSLKEAAREASRDAERALILSQLERTHWNRKRTARELQISYKALLYKLKQLGLDGSNQTEGQ